MLLFQQGREQEAREVLRQGVAFNPSNPQVCHRGRRASRPYPAPCHAGFWLGQRECSRRCSGVEHLPAKRLCCLAPPFRSAAMHGVGTG